MEWIRGRTSERKQQVRTYKEAWLMTLRVSQPSLLILTFMNCSFTKDTTSFAISNDFYTYIERMYLYARY